MPTYECTRQVECVVTIEADNDLDLKRQLGSAFPDADSLVENADVVVFGDSWQSSEVDSNRERGIISFTDAEIEHAVATDPDRWIE